MRHVPETSRAAYRAHVASGNCQTHADQVLWVLQHAGIKGLTAPEIYDYLEAMPVRPYPDRAIEVRRRLWDLLGENLARKGDSVARLNRSKQTLWYPAVPEGQGVLQL